MDLIIFHKAIISDSPMILDTTIEDGKEKKVYDREAIILSMPEYAEDIYEYLREAEASPEEFLLIWSRQISRKVPSMQFLMDCYRAKHI